MTTAPTRDAAGSRAGLSTEGARPLSLRNDLPLTRAALETYRRGRTPLALVPGAKRPARAAWQRLVYRDEAEVVREFGAMIVGAGLGVQLGGGLADVDLDTEAARRAAPLLLPPTPMRSGRESAPASHWWFWLADGSEHYVKHVGPAGSAVVEVRATTGHQTAIPPTVHPSGEPYRWEGRPWEAAEVSAAEVLAGAASVALVAVLADAWPGEGSRHDAYLALAGGLLRGCEDVPAMVTAAGQVVSALATLTDDHDGAQARIAEALPTTVRRLRARENVTGWTRLGELLPGDDAAAVVGAAQRAADDLRAALGMSAAVAAEPGDGHARQVLERLEWLRVRADADALYAAELTEASPLPSARDLLRPGGSLILDTPPEPLPVWGARDRVMLAEGESLVIVGGPGVGKTTLAQQWALGRCGLPTFDDLLGLPIVPGAGRVLYLAMDRPRQALRSLRRMVRDEDRARLDDRLVIWQGPPPVKLTEHPDSLAELCAQAGADSVVVDSLKDAGSMIDDEGGTGWNAARQLALMSGVAVLELHHNRKAQPGGRSRRPDLDDVYGSAWLTAGAGSVVLLDGKPGDPIVRLHHLKQPAAAVGPLDVLHDHARGRSTVWHEADLPALAARPEGVTAVQAARALFGTDKPDANQKAKARRRLQADERAGLLALLDPGDKGENRPARWGTGRAG